MVQGLKAAVYARVSSEEQVEGYSLDAQRRAFRALVEGRGWTVFQECLEEGRSAHTDDIRKRPVFKQASEAYGLSDAHIRRLLEYGKVKGEKVGRDWVIRPSTMDRYMGNRPKPGPKRRRRNAPRRTP